VILWFQACLGTCSHPSALRPDNAFRLVADTGKQEIVATISPVSNQNLPVPTNSGPFFRFFQSLARLFPGFLPLGAEIRQPELSVALKGTARLPFHSMNPTSLSRPTRPTRPT
jgi:hypothetical protein